MTLPRLAIVTPSYNTGRYIGAAIQSVMQQQGAAFDYIVMDGGSTDGTVDLLKSLGPKLRWVSQKDAGQSDAINRGFAQTDGEILGWLNADDVYAAGALRTVAEHFAAHPEVDVVYGNAAYIDAAGRYIANCAHVEPFSRRRLLHYSDFIVQPAAFFRRRAFEAVGGLDISMNWTMDYDLWIKFTTAGSRIIHIDVLMAYYRWLDNNKTAIGGWKRLEEIVDVLKRHGLGTPAYVQLEQCNMLASDARVCFGRVSGARLSATWPALRESCLLRPVLS